MARRSQHQAEEAAKAASEAARTLQKRGQEVKEQVPSNPDREPPEGWEPPKRNDTRLRMVEEIVASRPKQEPAPEPEEKVEPEVKAEEKPEPAPEATVEPVEAPVEAPKTVKAKVDGEELEASVEEVEASGGIKNWQIQKAAENRLRKANEALAEIRRTQAELAERAKEALKPKEPEITDDQFITERVDRIRFGTPEESAQALKEIMARSNKTVDPNKIIEQATGKFFHDQAVRQFDSEFQDLVTNPDLLDLIVVKRNKKLAQLQGAPADWAKFYRDIGNEVRSIVARPTSQATQGTTSGTPSQQSKEERKAAATVSVPASAARVAPPKEEKPETRADILKDMRKKRGLPVE
jgi:hypothetical protein